MVRHTDSAGMGQQHGGTFDTGAKQAALVGIEVFSTETKEKRALGIGLRFVVGSRSFKINTGSMGGLYLPNFVLILLLFFTFRFLLS